MPCYRTLLVLLVMSLTLAATQKKPNRTSLVKNPDSDDTEYLQVEATGDKKKQNNGKKENKSNTDDEKPKTLSQQISDGKYGLIQKELFSNPPKRPDILSYEANPEVPNDNIKTLGGLDKNEIWLAENHLLVLRGGSFPPYDDRKDTGESPWPPLDNYKAPLHQEHADLLPSGVCDATVEMSLWLPGFGIHNVSTTARVDHRDIFSPAGLTLQDGDHLTCTDNGANTPKPVCKGYLSPWCCLSCLGAGSVKIPKNPKVPPPFPVQLTENGPLQILGTGFTRTFNGTYEEALNAIPPPEGYPPFFAPPFLPQPYDTNSTNSTTRTAAMPIPVYPSGEYPAGLQIPSSLLNGTLPPSLGYLPPGAVILPPPGNQTDYPDYDDPSIYYPPPYSFYYPKDNNSLVPAGPLVPGIILPPPPNFFAPLEDTPTIIQPTRKPIRYRKPTTTQMTITITKTTSLPTTKKPTSSQKTVKIYPVKNHQYIQEVKHITSTTPAPKNTVTLLPEVLSAPHKVNYRPVPNKKPGITILKPVTPPAVYIYENEIPNKPFRHYGPPELSKIAVTTTQVPLRYHTTSNVIDSNSVNVEAGQRENLKKGKLAKTTYKPAQYYFYDEQEKHPEPPHRVPKTQSYSDINEPYYVRPKPIAPNRQKRPQYVYVTAKPYNTQKPRFRFIQQPVEQDSFSVHISNLKNQIQKYYTTPRTTYRTVPKPVYQFSFQAENYHPQQNTFKASPQANQQDQFQPIPAKYTVEIQQAIEIIPTETPKYQRNNRPYFYQHTTERPYFTTPEPEYNQEVTPRPKYVQNVATPRPISEYSFEATQNPAYQGFYTKPDENYFDDRTRTYFNMFGRKLPGGTTPIPRIEQSQNNQHRPISLEGDTLVNYVNPRPNINPDAEIIHVKDPPTYPNVVRYSSRHVDNNNNKPEIIKAIPIEVPSKESQDGSFISYQLPGDDGAHFYFLTPQLAQRKDQGVGFYYSKTRRRRNEETVDR